MRIAVTGVTFFILFAGLASTASALDLTQRRVSVDGKLSVANAKKIAEKLIAFDAQAEAPITMMITATKGSAQGVQLVADTIRSLRSPVVAAVITQVHGAGAAVAAFADRVLVYPSAGFVFTELAYEGVEKPKPPEPEKEMTAVTEDGKKAPAAEKPKPKLPEQELLQAARKTYLDRFNARLAKRLRWSSKKLAAKIAAGGFMVTADEAVRQKIADAVVEQITYTELPEIKREIKIITTDKRSRSVPRR